MPGKLAYITTKGAIEAFTVTHCKGLSLHGLSLKFHETRISCKCGTSNGLARSYAYFTQEGRYDSMVGNQKLLLGEYAMQPNKLVGQIIGHYRIIRPLGYGGSATVFLAEDIHLQREVALKVFQSRQDDPDDFLRRFSREARVLAQLDHPNILPVYDYGEQGEMAYLVMPHMAGGSLRDRLNKQKLLPKAEVVQLLSQALKALQYAHDHALIHRDIKPGNMLFKADGTLLLSDFGLVKIVPNADDLSTDPGESMNMTIQSISGTPYYMSPEQINGKAEPLTDIYAMGIVLYEMLAGEQPFQADNFIGILMKHLYEQPHPIRSLNPLVSPALEKVAMRALAKEASQRYQSPEEMRLALLQALDIDQAATVSSPSDPFHYSIQDRLTQSPTQANQRSNQATTNIPSWSASPFPYSSSAASANKTISVIPQVQPPRPVYAPPTLPERVRGSRAPLIISIVLISLILLTSAGTILYLNGVPIPGLRTRSRQIPIASPAINQPHAKVNPTYLPTMTAITSQMPPTSTTCPTTGTGQTMITAPLATGNDQNIVYIVNENNPVQGTIKRKDATTGTSGVEIQKMAGVVVLDAQVSNDGHWVLFTAKVGDHEELRMVRVDGQGLQTLYCTQTHNTLSSTPQWSLDQKHIIFAVNPASGPPITYLLDTSSGSVQTEILPSRQGNGGFIPRVWLDNRYVYMILMPPTSGVPLENVYLLDIQDGPFQQESNLKEVINSPLSCLSFDTSYDLAQLIVAKCNTDAQKSGTQTPLNQITIQPTHGGPTKTIFSSSTLAITMVRAISPTTLLLQVENNVGDLSQNGIWKLNIDGTGLKHLTSDSNRAQSLCQFSQYAWSNVSRDGTMFALQYYDPRKVEYAMSYEQLVDGTLKQYADISSGTTLQLVGWTNM